MDDPVADAGSLAHVADPLGKPRQEVGATQRAARWRIEAVRDLREMQQVGRFRHAIFRGELGRRWQGGGADCSVMLEPEDDEGVVLVAREGGELVGTGRWHRLGAAEFANLMGPLAPLACRLALRREVALVSRLMVAGRARGSRLWSRIACALYGSGLVDGIRMSLITVEPALVGFYRRLGYRELRRPRIETANGARAVLALALRDPGGLQQIGSPFARFCPPEDPDQEAMAAVDAITRPSEGAC